MGVSGYGILDRIVGYTEVIQFDGLSSYRTSALRGLTRALRQRDDGQTIDTFKITVAADECRTHRKCGRGHP